MTGTKFAVMTNRGNQIGLFITEANAWVEANTINARGLDVFAWVVEVPAETKPEDMPGRGFIYG